VLWARDNLNSDDITKGGYHSMEKGVGIVISTNETIEGSMSRIGAYARGVQTNVHQEDTVWNR
jgi:hypothetical protein